MSEGDSTTDYYAYDEAERMTRAGSTSYAYDKNGNLTSEKAGLSTTDYSYDFEDRMVKAGGLSYQRDALGRVVSKRGGGTTNRTEYLFDGGQVIEQKVGAEAPTHFTRGPAGRIASKRHGIVEPRYYHYDATGSVTLLTDKSGSFTDYYAYYAFGELRARLGNHPQPFQYLGNAYDSDTGLYDFHARSYDPGTGRFTSKDPVKGFSTKPQTLNPYAYGYNGPLAHPDPSGRLPFDFFLEQEAACATHDPYSEHPPPDYCPSDPAEEGTEEPIDRVEDPTPSTEAPEPPDSTGGGSVPYLNDRSGVIG